MSFMIFYSQYFAIKQHAGSVCSLVRSANIETIANLNTVIFFMVFKNFSVVKVKPTHGYVYIGGKFAEIYYSPIFKMANLKLEVS